MNPANLEINMGRGDLRQHEMQIVMGLVKILAEKCGVPIITKDFVAIVGQSFCAGLQVGLEREKITQMAMDKSVDVVAMEHEEGDLH